jgi:hypothetical protein
VQEETQNPGAEAAGDVEIEMPPESYGANNPAGHPPLTDWRYEQELAAIGLDSYE